MNNFLISARAALGFGVLDNPGGWTTPSLLEIPEGAAGGMVLVEELPLMQEIRLRGAEHSKGFRFWAAPRIPKAAESAPLSEAAQLVTEIFKESKSQLQRAGNLEKVEKAWENLESTFFMPAGDLPEARARIEEWLRIFGIKIVDPVVTQSGFDLNIFGLYQRLLQTSGEPRSLGRTVQKCLEATTQSGWGKALLERCQATRHFLQKGADEKWNAKDHELLLSIWNEPIVAAGEASVAKAAVRAVRFIEGVDLNHLEEVKVAQAIFNLWCQKTTAETVGSRFQLDDEAKKRLAPRMEMLQRRAKAGESAWVKGWRADADLPQTEDGFFTLDVFGQSVTLTVESLAWIEAPELKKRLADIRTTPENRAQVAWTFLKEKMQEEDQQEALLELLRNLQRVMNEKGTKDLKEYRDVDEWKKEIKSILEGSCYYTTRVGNGWLILSPDGYDALRDDDTALLALSQSGLRTFNSNDQHLFKRKNISSEERNHFLGSDLLFSLGEGIPKILTKLDDYKWMLQPPAWISAYNAIMAAVGKGDISPLEGGVRLLKLTHNEAREEIMAKFDWLLREPVDPELRQQLAARFSSEGLEFFRRAFVGGEEELTVVELRNLLHIYTDKGKGVDAGGGDSSSLRRELGDLLEYGRKASPFDDRYSVAEFEQLLDIHQRAVAVVKELWSAVAFFKRAATDGPFLDAREGSVAWRAALLDPNIPSHVDIGKIVREKLRVKEITPALLKEKRTHRAIEEACWMEVCVAAIKNFKQAALGEAYDEGIFEALAKIYGSAAELSLADRKLLSKRLLLPGTVKIKIGDEEFLKPNMDRFFRHFKSWVNSSDVSFPVRWFESPILSPSDRMLFQSWFHLICLLGDWEGGKGIPSLNLKKVEETSKATLKKLGIPILR